MKILVTAGNTQTPIDQVRCITNVFSGRTGARIAVEAFERGHTITLLTSHPEVLDGIPGERSRSLPEWRVRSYRTFDDLEALMAEEIGAGVDVVIHAAALSDFHVAGIFSHHEGGFVDASAGKVKSSHPELWLKLMPAPKLIDKIRTEWLFLGTLVKFKLEVGITDDALLDIAERSRVQSGADLMCANTLEGMADWAFIGTGEAGYRRTARVDLASYLIQAIENVSTHSAILCNLPAFSGIPSTNEVRAQGSVHSKESLS